MAVRIRGRFRGPAILLAAAFALAAGCGRAPPPPVVVPAGPVQTAQAILPRIELPRAEQRLGTAVVVLVDTSGSMSQVVADHSGKPRPRHEIARDALARIVQVTDDWSQKHSDSKLFLGIVNFSSATATVLPMGPFDPAAAKESLARIPPPAGGTAIGLALEEGFKALYGTGCIRKHLVCITDGENTVSTPPDLMARQLHAQTKGEVELHFVAFDTSARHFAFLQQVNGSVDEADGARLQERLVDLYEKRILVEAMPAEKE